MTGAGGPADRAAGLFPDGAATVATEQGDSPKRGTGTALMQVFGLATEFGAGLAGCTLLGYWVDRALGSMPVATVTGAILGCVGGMYHLIRRGFEIQKKMNGARRAPGRDDDEQSA